MGFLDVLRRALWRSEKLHLTYTNSSMGNHDVKTRIIRPYGLIVKNGEWYLAAYCESRQDIRVFKCERIVQAELLEEPFSIPSDFCLETFWKQWVAQFKDAVSNKPLYPVELKLWSQSSDCLANIEILNKSENRDGTVVRVNLLSYENACQQIIRFNDNVEVLAPLDLIKFVINNSKKVLSRYIEGHGQVSALINLQNGEFQND